jgi:HEAT repeat protein
MGLLGAEEAAGVFFGPAAIGVALAGQMLRDNGAPDRAFCAQMLGLDPSSQATAALVKAAHDKNWVVRASAAEGLGNSSRPHAMRVLAGLLKDPKPPVRYMAAASLIRLRTPAPASGAATQSADKR